MLKKESEVYLKHVSNRQQDTGSAQDERSLARASSAGGSSGFGGSGGGGGSRSTRGGTRGGDGGSGGGGAFGGRKDAARGDGGQRSTHGGRDTGLAGVRRDRGQGAQVGSSDRDTDVTAHIQVVANRRQALVHGTELFKGDAELGSKVNAAGIGGCVKPIKIVMLA